MTNAEKTRSIALGAQQAVAEAIERHRRLGESIVIWRDGKIVTLTAEEIPPLSGLEARAPYSNE